MSEQHGWTQPGGGPAGDRPPQGPPPQGAPAPGQYGQGQYGQGTPTPGQYGQGAPAPGQYGPGPYGPGAWSQPALKPGIVPLRPITLGEIYDGSFQALRSNPRTMVGTTALVVTVIALVDLLIGVLMARTVSGLLTLDPEAEVTDEQLTEMFGALGALGIGAAISLFFNIFGIAVLTGLLTLAVSDAVLGRRVPLGELWQRARGRLLPLIGLTLLTTLAYVGIVLAAIAPAVLVLFVEPVAGAVLLLVGGLAGLAGLLWLYAKLALATPALMLEHQSVMGAWRRSWQLTRGSFWRVLGIVLLTVVLTAIAVALVSVPFQIGAALMSFANPDDPLTAAAVSTPQLLLQAVGQILSSTIVYPFTAAVTALLYVDLRMRREGLDVQLARAAQEQGGR